MTESTLTFRPHSPQSISLIRERERGPRNRSWNMQLPHWYTRVCTRTHTHTYKLSLPTNTITQWTLHCCNSHTDLNWMDGCKGVSWTLGNISHWLTVYCNCYSSTLLYSTLYVWGEVNNKWFIDCIKPNVPIPLTYRRVCLAGISRSGSGLMGSWNSQKNISNHTGMMGKNIFF